MSKTPTNKNAKLDDTISIRLKKETREALRRAALLSERSESWIARKAIERQTGTGGVQEGRK